MLDRDPLLTGTMVFNEPVDPVADSTDVPGGFFWPAPPYAVYSAA